MDIGVEGPSFSLTTFTSSSALILRCHFIVHEEMYGVLLAVTLSFR